MQNYKQLIDTGVKGNSSTGDILYDGGEKLNSNMTAIWNVFGDQRLYDETVQGVDKQILHATGYFQKHPRQYYLDTPNGVEPGSLHDVDTSAGKLDIKLPSGKLGEGIVIINSNGSLSVDNPVVLSTYGSDTILGHGKSIVLDIPKSKTTVWCTVQEKGTAIWEYKIESMFGFQHIPIDVSIKLATTPTELVIGNKNSYNALKFLIHAISQDKTKIKTSEMLVNINHLDNSLKNTEYAVLKTNDDELYNLEFFIEHDVLKARVSSTSGNVNFSIKSTDSIKMGTV